MAEYPAAGDGEAGWAYGRQEKWGALSRGGEVEYSAPVKAQAGRRLCPGHLNAVDRVRFRGTGRQGRGARARPTGAHTEVLVRCGLINDTNLLPVLPLGCAGHEG